MKTIITTITFLILGLTTFSQTPTSFNYQAVLRDASGGILANQQVEIGVALLQGSVTGTEIFTETHSVTTNNFGLANLQIGSVNMFDMEFNMPFATLEAWGESVIKNDITNQSTVQKRMRLSNLLVGQPLYFV